MKLRRRVAHMAVLTVIGTSVSSLPAEAETTIVRSRPFAYGESCYQDAALNGSAAEVCAQSDSSPAGLVLSTLFFPPSAAAITASESAKSGTLVVGGQHTIHSFDGPALYHSLAMTASRRSLTEDLIYPNSGTMRATARFTATRLGEAKVCVGITRMEPTMWANGTTYYGPTFGFWDPWLFLQSTCSESLSDEREIVHERQVYDGEPYAAMFFVSIQGERSAGASVVELEEIELRLP